MSYKVEFNSYLRLNTCESCANYVTCVNPYDKFKCSATGRMGSRLRAYTCKRFNGVDIPLKRLHV